MSKRTTQGPEAVERADSVVTLGRGRGQKLANNGCGSEGSHEQSHSTIEDMAGQGVEDDTTRIEDDLEGKAGGLPEIEEHTRSPLSISNVMGIDNSQSPEERCNEAKVVNGNNSDKAEEIVDKVDDCTERLHSRIVRTSGKKVKNVNS